MHGTAKQSFEQQRGPVGNPCSPRRSNRLCSFQKCMGRRGVHLGSRKCANCFALFSISPTAPAGLVECESVTPSILILQIQLGCTGSPGDRCQCSPLILKGPMQFSVPPFQTRYLTRDTSRSCGQGKIVGFLQQSVVFNVPSSANPSELATVKTHRPGGILAVSWIFAWSPARLAPLLACCDCPTSYWEPTPEVGCNQHMATYFERQGDVGGFSLDAVPTRET